MTRGIRGGPLERRDIDEGFSRGTTECWVNSLYQVLVYRNEAADEMVHVDDMKGRCTWLSIKLRTKQPMKGPLDWQTIQDMKNLLCGIDCDAMQIFPRREFLVNSANQYHLIVLPPEVTMPFGWKFSMVRDGDEHNDGTKQNFTSTTENVTDFYDKKEQAKRRSRKGRANWKNT